jgi:hypothetical protein
VKREEALSEALKKALLGGDWFLITGSQECIEEFKREYYRLSGGGEFTYRPYIVGYWDSRREYIGVFLITLAKKKKGLEKLLGQDAEKIIHVNLRKNERGECTPRVELVEPENPEETVDRVINWLFRAFRIATFQKIFTQK